MMIHINLIHINGEIKDNSKHYYKLMIHNNAKSSNPISIMEVSIYYNTLLIKLCSILLPNINININKGKNNSR